MAEITVSTLVRAPMQTVWRCWNEPEHIMQWCHADDSWHAPTAENDLREDGRFKTTMAAKDGSAEFDFEGTYTTVIPHELIEYAMDDGRKVRIGFEAMEDGIRVMETFDAETQNSEELQRAGWQAILENFRKHAEAQV